MRALLLVVCACGRIGFDDSSAAPDGVLAARSCWSSWLGSVTLTTPARIEELVNGSDRLSNPTLSGDRLTLYYELINVGGGDLMMATRPTLDDPWRAAGPISELNTAAEESRLSVTSDGLIAVFVRAGAPAALVQASRQTTSEPFANLTTTPFAALVDASSKWDPELIGSDRLYFSEAVTPQVIELATRVDSAAAFDPATPIQVPMTSVADPALSPDERVMVFSNSTGPNRDLYYATRASANDPFGPAQALSVNTAADEGDADVSIDGCEIMYSSNANGRELWAARVIE